MLTIPRWNDSLSVGNPDVDQQHKRLLTMCQRFVNLLDDPARSPAELEEYANDVAEFMQHHFATEEALLRKSRCPNLNDHVAEHHALYSAVVLELSNAIADIDFDLGKFTTVMTEWLSHHLHKTDMRDRAFLRGY